jgi:membrane-associated protease RseP (regulator of RpoE activity)
MVNILEAVFFIIFFSIVSIRLYKRRKNVKFEKGLIFEYSQKYVELINNYVENHKKVFKIIGLISLISTPILLLVGPYFIITSLISLRPSVALVLPTVSGYKYPGPIISIPFWYWIISIFLIVLPHESLHALIARSEDIKTKRYGLLYLLLLPIGAFVDIDEVKLKKSKLTSKIKIFSAGSLGNLITALFFFILLILTSQLFSFLIEPIGVKFNNTIKDSPAEKVKLEGIIYAIDNQTIKDVFDLQNFLLNAKPNSTVEIKTSKGIFNLTLEEKNGRPFIGIYGVQTYFVFKWNKKEASPIVISIFSHLFSIFQWILFLSIGVAIANMLPIVPLDGGLIVREALKEFLGNKRGEKISKIISIVFLLLLFASLSLSSIKPLMVS